MAEPGRTAVKTLFALSGNTCYYDKCEEPMTRPGWTEVNGEIAHIQGEKPTAARFDRTLTDKQRNSFENLMLMCPRHHKLIDRLEPDSPRHSVASLQEMKEKHEDRSKDKTRWATDAELERFALFAVVRLGVSNPEERDAYQPTLDIIAEPPDPIDGLVRANGRDYDRNVRLWVRVTNHGPDAELSAQVTNTRGFPASWGDYTKPIAWEQTSEQVLRVPPETHALLRLANVSRSPSCFWFYGPQTMYTKEFHTIWQQNHHTEDGIEFDLEVVNATTDERVTRRGVVSPPAEDVLPVFTLSDIP